MLTGHGQARSSRWIKIQRLRVMGSGSTGVKAHRSSPEHGGAKATARYRWFREARLLTRRSRGRGEAGACVRWSRRVGVSPEWLAEVAAAARARRSCVGFALWCKCRRQNLSGEALRHEEAIRGNEGDNGSPESPEFRSFCGG